LDNNLSQFDGKPFLNLETIRKNGQVMKTPVWFTQDGDVIYVRTVAGSGKVKRVRNNGTVRIVPCEANGTPTGEWVTAQAVEIMDDGINNLVAGLLDEKYGMERVRQFEAATIARGNKYTILKIELQ
jgi:PPOX class probable F420-dependent enzyme